MTQNAVTLDLVRTVRISDTSITLSFRTNVESIGSVTYTSVLDEDRTLTDSVPQTDHVFTLTDLDPSHGYTFTLHATHGSDASYTYTVLLAPETIGEPGQSLMPEVKIASSDGTAVATIPTSSTTPTVPSHTDGILILVLLAAVVGVCWYVASRRKAHKKHAGAAIQTEEHL